MLKAIQYVVLYKIRIDVQDVYKLKVSMEEHVNSNLHFWVLDKTQAASALLMKREMCKVLMSNQRLYTQF